MNHYYSALDNKSVVSKKTLDLNNPSVIQAKKINEIANDIKDKYAVLIDNISNKYKDNPFWWATNLSSRDGYLSCSFYNICLLEFLKDSSLDEFNRIIVPSSGLKKAVLKNINLNIPVETEKKNIKSGRKAFDRFLSIGFFGKCIIFKQLVNRYRLVKKHADYRNISELQGRHDQDVLIREPRMISEFSENGFTDRYITDIDKYAKQSIVYFDNIIYSNEKEATELIKKLSGLPRHILIEQLIRIQDIRYAMQYFGFCKKISFKDIKFDDLEISDILEEDLIRGTYNLHDYEGILRGLAFKNLVNEYGFKPRILIEWYEGQPASHAFIHTIRNCFSDVQTVAYTYGTIGQNSCELSPTKSQMISKAVPEVYAIHGICWREHISRYEKKLKWVITPSFRDQWVFERREPVSIQKGSIIAILSLFEDETKSMLQALAEAVPALGYPHIYLKNHPGLKNYTLSDYGIDEGFYAGCEISYCDGDALSESKDKEIVITVATTMLVPILLFGKKVINFCPTDQLINLYAPGILCDNINIAYDGKDIVDAILYGKPAIKPDMAERIRNDCFTIVNEDSVERFFREIEAI